MNIPIEYIEQALATPYTEDYYRIVLVERAIAKWKTDQAELEEYRQLVRDTPRCLSDGDLEMDNDATVSVSDDGGAYVQCWKWVYEPETEEEEEEDADATGTP